MGMAGDGRKSGKIQIAIIGCIPKGLQITGIIMKLDSSIMKQYIRNLEDKHSKFEIDLGTSIHDSR
ncbi:hypothetical protein [Desulfitobacterium hafniense]|uniref:Uncharacterized protein n=2 Tax=root TaxID=1 RepID=A0A098B9T5_DESHA|nr:hypothetical protein [Desulfitobacterium hafniense]MEA5022842.1 hypothetical protein [Desulfitobacterium hafniense]CDX04631.1 Hypothetical protein DPCES_4745 [Desulfitobacterium hafniense]